MDREALKLFVPLSEYWRHWVQTSDPYSTAATSFHIVKCVNEETVCLLWLGWCCKNGSKQNQKQPHEHAADQHIMVELAGWNKPLRTFNWEAFHLKKKCFFFFFWSQMWPHLCKFTPRCQLDTSVNNVAGLCDPSAAVRCGKERGRVSRLETTPLWWS